jgi:hypothetical protein
MEVIFLHSHAPFLCKEIKFWEEVSIALSKNGFELIKAGYVNNDCCSQHRTIYPFVSIPDGLDHPFYFFDDRKETFQSIVDIEIDYDSLLEREALWRDFYDEKPQKPEKELSRKNSIDFWYSFYSLILFSTKPKLSIIWNGQHPQEMILESLCQKTGCPVIYAERAFIPYAIHVDQQGILGGSDIAKSSTWNWGEDVSKPKYSQIARNISDKCSKSSNTWWKQPVSSGKEKIRKALKISSSSKVIIFAGQVDQDTQSFLFSPFQNNLEAFAWFCEELSKTNADNIFLLGKHHPKSSASPDAYLSVIQNTSIKGIWVSDLSMSDCLSLADRVAAVNSTVIYEALMARKPTLCMGNLILSNKNIAYEVHPTSSDNTQVFQDWLNAKDFVHRYEKWMDFLAYLIASSFFSVDKNMQEMGMLGSGDFAKYLVATLEKQQSLNPVPDYQELKIDPIDIFRLLEWKQAEANFWQQQVRGMQSSQFWKLREQWVALKRLLRLNQDL